ncbi:MAG: hypothetical protein FJ104_17905, partial [Deltaproteobacteria bacterium]|nr:hypothetical protein [Deltaproteobacteria bacterium]
SIERAWAAWELDGTTDRDIARLARLLDKAHRAIRDAPAATLDAAYNDVAQVLWAGLPRAVKARRELPDALQVVRGLRGDADAWAAVVEAVARLLGWDTTGRAHAAQAVRVAVMSNRNE